MIVIGDFHLKYSEPYWHGQKLLLEHLAKTYSDHSLCFTGDVFDTSTPHWEVFRTFYEFCRNRKEPVYIVHGNHEYSQIKGSCLRGLESVATIFYEKTELNLPEGNFLFLPFRYNLEEMKAYGDLTSEHDWVVTHITHTKYQFGQEGVDLKLKAKFIFHGHIHVADTFDNQVMVGVPQTTRNLEQFEHKRVVRIEDGKWYSDDLPIFTEIRDVEFGVLPENKWDYYNVLNAPSSKSVYEMYRGYFVRQAGISFKVVKTEQPKVEQGLPNRFKQFLLDNPDVSLSAGAEAAANEYFSRFR